MSVYVDPCKIWGGADAPYCFKFKPSCHMYADTMVELHAMAKKIGLKMSWFQDSSSLRHYDLTESKRRLAVKAGAVEVDFKHLVEFMREYKNDNHH